MALTDHFAVAFVRENVVWVYDVCGDVLTFENLMLRLFCLEESSVRKGIF